MENIIIIISYWKVILSKTIELIEFLLLLNNTKSSKNTKSSNWNLEIIIIINSGYKVIRSKTIELSEYYGLAGCGEMGLWWQVGNSWKFTIFQKFVVEKYNCIILINEKNYI